MSRSHYAEGVRFEQKAVAYLQRHNMIVLERRYKTPYGEIDILARDGNVLVAVEVKRRKQELDAYESIQDKQKNRIADALLYYCSEHNIADPSLRFDAILFFGHDLVYIKDAWSC